MNRYYQSLLSKSLKSIDKYKILKINSLICVYRLTVILLYIVIMIYSFILISFK